MWWSNLTDFEQVIFIIASSATILMLLLLILMIVGIDSAESFDGGLDSIDVDVFNDEPFSAIGGLKIISIRGILAFFSFGGWTVYLLADSMNNILALVIGIIVGSLAMVLTAYIFKQIFRLESSGNMNYTSAIGKLAVVYMRVPKSKSGTGKVTLVHQERMVEVDAVTESDTDLMPRTQVEVVGLDGPNTLVVKIKG
ncbi:MAG: hypothetical protein ACOCUE_03275 [Candidatus Izemoplasmataceae bacterium]